MKSIAVCFGILLMSYNTAHAYLDGGTGSMLLQLALGGFVGFFAIIKLYWYRVKSFFCKEKLLSEEKADVTEAVIDPSVSVNKNES